MGSIAGIVKTLADLEAGFELLKQEHVLLEESMRDLGKIFNQLGTATSFSLKCGGPKDAAAIQKTMIKVMEAATLLNQNVLRYIVGFESGVKILKEIDFEAVEKLLEFQSAVEKPKQKRRLN